MKLRFIVINDVEGIRNIFRVYLMALGHEVVCAEHPLAETVCKKTQCTQKFACFDGYLVDLSMPHMTGIEFLESSFRRACKTPPRNRVLMSGYLSQNACDKAKELGVTLVDKPVRLSKIGDLVEEMQNRVDPNRRLADLPST